MQNIQSKATPTHSFEIFLAAAGAFVSLLLSVRAGQVVSLSQPMWPLPGLYLIETAGVSFIALLGIVRGGSLGASVAWSIVGLLLAFAAMGAWSIGLLFLPVALIFALAANLSDRRQGLSVMRHIGLSVLAGMAQIILMFTVVRLMQPIIF